MSGWDRAMRPFTIYLYGPDAGPLPLGFESAQSRLGRLPRMDCEADGALLWVGEVPCRWQLEGTLFDRGGQLQYVELKGVCPHRAWRELLTALVGSPEADLLLLELPERVRMSRQAFEAKIWPEGV